MSGIDIALGVVVLALFIRIKVDGRLINRLSQTVVEQDAKLKRRRG